MAYNTMLIYAIKLDQETGGVLPEVHLKQGMTSMRIRLQISPRDHLVNAYNKAVVFRAVLPDGTDFFTTGSTSLVDTELTATLFNQDVERMTRAVGKFRCTLTILDSAQQATRQNYMNRNFLTVLPFTVIVHKAAYKEV